MSGLNLFRSNRLEHLADIYATRFGTNPPAPFEQEHVLVQSIGMGRWLSLELCERLGIWAGYSYLYPNAFADMAFSAAIPEYAGRSGHEKQIWTWSIMKELHSELANPGQNYRALLRYAGKCDQGMLYQLAGRIADLFDQYITGRPETILHWEGEPPQQTEDSNDPFVWQRNLWLAISGKQPHKAALRSEFIEFCARYSGEVSTDYGLPKRISVFGISTLPHFHLEMLGALSGLVDIDMYLLSPTREFWEDIRSRSQQAREQYRHNPGVDPSLLHFDEGNPVLAAMGQLGREFMILLEEQEPHDQTTEDDYLDPGRDSLLHHLQSDILDLQNRAESAEHPKIAADDRSIRIHCCHSPMREVEILRDTLLDLFNNDPSLNPRDILVMTPDIDNYAPFIEAVFGVPEEPSLRLPYSIADRNLKQTGRLIEAFFRMLDLGPDRFTLSMISDIISTVPVREHYDLEEEDVSRIISWLAESGFRWGVDKEDRLRHCHVAFDEFSCLKATSRLILGSAMRHNNGKHIHDIAPFDIAEGSETEMLGAAIACVHELADWAVFQQNEHTIVEWHTRLDAIVAAMFSVNQRNARELDILHRGLAAMNSSAQEAGYEHDVPWSVIRQCLEAEISADNVQFGFLNGRITFCAMLPMRSIPFRVIALLGLGDGDFPRTSNPLSFDLMGKNPRLGDRSQRKDDRYLFLETILSARDILHISHPGISSRDNTTRPPSVVVRELLDYIDRGYQSDNATPVSCNITVNHPLHPFSRKYFDGSSMELFSYSHEMQRASLRNTEYTARPFCAKRLEITPAEDLFYPSPDLLKKFYSNPCDFFLRYTLGMRWPFSELIAEDNEPSKLEFANSITLAERILSDEKISIEDIYDDARREALLPPLAVGKISFDMFATKVKKVRETILREQEGKLLETVIVNRQLITTPTPLHVTGVIQDVCDGRILRGRHLKYKTDWIRLWIDHLFLCADNLSQQKPSCFFWLEKKNGKETIQSFRIAPVATAEAVDILTKLGALYIEGLHQPLRFFPKTSYEYIRVLNNPAPKSMEDTPENRTFRARSAARESWQSTWSKATAESDHPAYRCCFGNETGEALDHMFEELAVTIGQTFINHSNGEAGSND